MMEDMSTTWVPELLHKGIHDFVLKNSLKAATYIDLGCGEGKLTRLIAEAVKPCNEIQEVYGVDSSEMLLEKLPRSVKALRCDLNNDKLPFPDCYFDLVSASEVIEHLQNTDNLVEESYRVLKPNGCFLITSPNLASWINRLLLFSGFQPLNTEPSVRYYVGSPSSHKHRTKYSGHLNLFTMRALLEMLCFHGFKIVAKTGSPIEYNVAAMTAIEKLLCRRASLASAIIILAKKPRQQKTDIYSAKANAQKRARKE